MSCCWRPVAHRQAVANGRRAPAPEGNGVIPLAAYPDATQPHSGQHRADSVYLVGWRTEHERLFAGADAKAAVVYRNSIDRDLGLDLVPTTQLPAQAVTDLYDGR